LIVTLVLAKENAPMLMVAALATPVVAVGAGAVVAVGAAGAGVSVGVAAAELSPQAARAKAQRSIRPSRPGTSLRMRNNLPEQE
jgi:hypothetical protein